MPVIATENTGAPDVVRHGVDGLIVPARSARAIRDSLEYLATNRARCVEMGAAAAASIGSFRSWDAFAADMLAQYRGAMRTHERTVA